MTDFQKNYYRKRGQLLVKNLQKNHFDAWYCDNKEEALAKALELIPEGASVGWGGALSAQQIGLIDAVRKGNYTAIDRDVISDPVEKVKVMKQAMLADVFIVGANALSMDGQMVSIDGNGNRVAAIVYGPDSVIVIAGMNKAVDTLEEAVRRARTVAAPINKQRFSALQTPCEVTGKCADCHSESCICNQLLITRNSKPAGRIKVVLVGEDLGF